MSKRRMDSRPTCRFCGRSGNGVLFAVFTPRYAPFGSACTECEKAAPKGWPLPERVLAADERPAWAPEYTPA